MTGQRDPSTVQIYAADELHDARAEASLFVMEQARATSAQVGFGWVAVPEAPTSFPALQAAYAQAARTGEPLPVSNQHSDHVMFIKSTTNHALRFWHDVHHVQLNLSFDLVDELELALWLLGVAKAAGIVEGSLTWRLLHADFVGQVYLLALSRRYPVDQWRFAAGCVNGLDRGVLSECRRLL
jgi:hypothetical protein